MAKSKAKPVKKTPAKPSKPAAKPVAKAAGKSSAKGKPVAKPAAKTPAKPVAKAKPVSKSAKAPAKPVAKAKAAPAPKKVEKASVKKAEVKKPVAPAKKNEKIEKVVPVKSAKAEVVKPAKPAKVDVKKEVVKPEPKDLKKSSKIEDAKKDKGGKKTRPVKNEEEDIDDDFIADDLGGSEIEEYEEELAIVEELDEEEVEEGEEIAVEVKDRDSEEIILTDAEGNRYCRARDCDQIANVDAYCRYHYLLYWRKIQNRKKILADGKLERYIDELTARYPDKFLEMIRRDLRSEKDFLAAIQEMEIDESGMENEFEEDASSFIDEVRGMGESTGVEDDEF